MQRFNWEKYLNFHQSPRKLLERVGYIIGGGIDNKTKILHFNDNIKADAVLEDSLFSAHSNCTNYTTFQKFVNFMMAEVEYKKHVSQTAQCCTWL